MKYLLLIGIFIGFLAISYAKEQNMDQLANEDLSDEGKMLYGFVKKEGRKIEKKYGMSQCCVGGGADNGIWLMSLGFNLYGEPLIEEKARRLIISCLHDYLEAVNKDEKLKPFLKVYPFTAKNIELAIYSSTIERKNIFHPYIAVVSADEGKIGYFTNEESMPYKYKSKKYETYEEAIAILQKEKEQAN